MCLVFLALFAGIGDNTAVLATTGLGLFMVASLFAAISALGPKFRPTPLLTPTMAGTIGAALMSVAIIAAGNLPPGQGQHAGLRQSAPPPAMNPPPVALSVVTMAPIPSTPPVQSRPPVQSAPPVVQMAPAVPMTPEPQVPLARMAAPAPSGPAEVPPAASAPVESVRFAPDADVAPTGADEPAGSSVSESSTQVALAPVGPPAQIRIPLPPIPPRLSPLSEQFVLAVQPFDPSSASTVANTPFIPSPPLPRSRPCGEDGPPCP